MCQGGARDWEDDEAEGGLRVWTCACAILSWLWVLFAVSCL